MKKFIVSVLVLVSLPVVFAKAPKPSEFPYTEYTTLQIYNLTDHDYQVHAEGDFTLGPDRSCPAGTSVVFNADGGEVDFNSDIPGMSVPVLIHFSVWGGSNIVFNPEGSQIHICNPSSQIFYIQEKPCVDSPKKV